LAVPVVGFTPDGKPLLPVGLNDRQHRPLDGPAAGRNVRSRKRQRHVFSGDAKGLVEQLVFHPEGKWLLGVGGDNGGFWQVYDLAEKKVTRSEKAPMHVHAASLSDDATQLCAVGHGKIVVWQLENANQGA
jgi:hypothetical protein